MIQKLKNNNNLIQIDFYDFVSLVGFAPMAFIFLKRDFNLRSKGDLPTYSIGGWKELYE